jgi:hypothetical protein
MRIIAVGLVAAFVCTATTSAAVQAHTPLSKHMHRFKHHAVWQSDVDRRNMWPHMTTGSPTQGSSLSSSWNSGIEQMDSTPSGE